MVAIAINIDKDCITLVRQQHIIIERVAITEGIDKVKLVLEQKAKIIDITNIDKETSSKEIKIELKQEAPTEEIYNQKIIMKQKQLLKKKKLVQRQITKTNLQKLDKEYLDALCDVF